MEPVQIRAERSAVLRVSAVVLLSIAIAVTYVIAVADGAVLMAGYFGVALLAVAVVYAARESRTPPVLLELSAEGLKIRGRALLPWRSIGALRIFRPRPIHLVPMAWIRMLGLIPADPDDPRFWTASTRMSVSHLGVPIAIAENGLPITLEELAELIRRFHDVPVEYGQALGVLDVRARALTGR